MRALLYFWYYLWRPHFGPSAIRANDQYARQMDAGMPFIMPVKFEISIKRAK